jgi:creatinine amidohydrolase
MPPVPPVPPVPPLTPRPYILNELTWKTVRDARYEVAVLPWGATEAHNLHLPYSTDNVETERIAALAAQRAWDRGARVVVLPLVPFGVNTLQLDIPLCVNMNPSTQAMVLRDIATSLAGQGIPKLVVLNGHGGNDFRQLIRELQPAVSLFLCLVNWYQVVEAKAYFTDLGDHAGELETSVMLHVAPELVRPLSSAGPGRARRFAVAALREGWAWAPRRWRQVTDDTGVGNPAAATPQKGRKYVEAVTEKIGDFLVDLAKADTAKMYE